MIIMELYAVTKNAIIHQGNALGSHSRYPYVYRRCASSAPPGNAASAGSVSAGIRLTTIASIISIVSIIFALLLSFESSPKLNAIFRQTTKKAIRLWLIELVSRIWTTDAFIIQLMEKVRGFKSGLFSTKANSLFRVNFYFRYYYRRLI